MRQSLSKQKRYKILPHLVWGGSWHECKPEEEKLKALAHNEPQRYVLHAQPISCVHQLWQFLYILICRFCLLILMMSSNKKNQPHLRLPNGSVAWLRRLYRKGSNKVVAGS